MGKEGVVCEWQGSGGRDDRRTGLCVGGVDKVLGGCEGQGGEERD